MFVSARMIFVFSLALSSMHPFPLASRADEAKLETETTALTGTLVDSAGTPISGAKLTVIGVWKLVHGNREHAPGGGSGTSDAEGRVTIERLPKGRILSIRFSHPDFQRSWLEVTTISDPALARKTTRWEVLADGFRKTIARPRSVQIRLVGNDGATPLANVVVEARLAPDTDEIHFDREWSARVATDPQGFAILPLSQGRYELSLSSERPLDCIELNEPRIGVRGVDHFQTFLRMTRRGTEVTFKAVDVDSGRPIPGVSFWREMPAGEYWFELVRDETIGTATDVRDEDGRKAPYVTDNDGLYRCQMRPERGWTYHVHHRPAGYEEVDAVGQTFDIPSEGRVEKTFFLRKKAE